MACVGQQNVSSGSKIGRIPCGFQNRNGAVKHKRCKMGGGPFTTVKPILKHLVLSILHSF